MSLFKDAASVLEEMGLRSNSDIQSLTREDLNDLFPGRENFKLRREIFDIIHKQKPVDALVKELKGFIPSEHFRAALTNNGVLVDYLHILKDMKTDMKKVQDFLDGHIGLLEEFRQENLESDRGGPFTVLSSSDSEEEASGAATSPSNRAHGVPQRSQGDTVNTERTWDGPGRTGPDAGNIDCGKGSTADARGDGGRGDAVVRDGLTGSQVSKTAKVAATAMEVQRHETDAGASAVSEASGAATSHSNRAHGVPQRSQVIYRIIVRGKTFDSHLSLMDKVKNQKNDEVQFVESNEDHQVTVVFCTIASHVGCDVKAALSVLKDNKPVILVLMFHKPETSHTPIQYIPSEANIVLHVDVLYHVTAPGLLRCSQNDSAVYQIRQKLLGFSTPRF